MEKFTYHKTTYITEDGEIIEKKELKDLAYKRIKKETEKKNNKINTYITIKIYGRQRNLWS